MLPEDFEAAVDDAIETIPADLAAAMNNVAIFIEDEYVPGPGEDPSTELLGLYEGKPLTERSFFDGFTMPDRITIYQGPHERMAGSPEELTQMVADTVWHEIAHYFGMDEPRVRRAERRRARRGQKPRA